MARIGIFIAVVLSCIVVRLFSLYGPGGTSTSLLQTSPSTTVAKKVSIVVATNDTSSSLLSPKFFSNNNTVASSSHNINNSVINSPRNNVGVMINNKKSFGNYQELLSTINNSTHSSVDPLQTKNNAATDHLRSKKAGTDHKATTRHDTIQQLAKAWEPVPDPSTWCVPNNNNAKLDGMFYAKLFKAASSTGAGVTLQISKNVAQRLNYTKSCKSHTAHGDAFTKRTGPNFLWTMIREPAKRCISNFFFAEVGRRGRKPSSNTMISYLKRWKGFELHYLTYGKREMPKKSISYRYSSRSNSYTKLQEQKTIRKIKNSVMNSYNFVGLVERMDESLVVLKMLMNLRDEDIIVLPSKESGGYTDAIFYDRCTFIQKSFTTPQVDAYIEKDFKNENTNADYLLYDVINQSLDLTIESLGRELVQEGVRKHRELKEIANKYCASKAIFPCSSTGVKQPQYKSSCLWRDAACGYQCVADVLERYKNGELEEES